MIILPHSAAAEQALLGLIMLDNSQYEIVKGQLPAEEFFIPLNAAMYKAIGVLIEGGMEANPITVADSVAGEEFGRQEALVQEFNIIFDAASRGSSATTYAFVISRKAYERKIIENAAAMTAAVNGNDEETYKRLQNEFSTINQTFSSIRPENALQQLRDSFEAASVGGCMMKTGNKNWDDAFGGVFKGSRYIIAGHGGVGKSAFAVNLAWNMSRERKVRWITFEEDAVALWWRIQSRHGRVHIGKFRQGLEEGDKEQLVHVQHDMIGPDFVVYKNLDKVANIIQTCGQCDLIVIDGITSWPLPQAESKVEKAGIVTEYAKTIADMTGAAVIMLSHVNGDGIKNGASITGLYGGQAATFDPEGIVELRFADKEALEGVEEREVKMHIIKNRYGPPNIVKRFAYNGKYQSYRELF